MSNIRSDKDIFDLLETNVNKGFRLVVEKYSTRLYQAENQYRIQLLNEFRERNQVRANQNPRQR